MSGDGRWIAEAEVCALIDLPDAIDAVRAALREGAGGASWTMEKTHASWGGGHTLHALGGGLGAAGLVGTKTWAHTDGGATPLLLLWDAEEGRLLAAIEAFALGQLRTAAVSGVATDALAAPDARVAALIGGGRQALPQLAAVAAVRPLRELRVWSPTRERRERFAERVRELQIGEVRVAASVAEATDGAAVITTATRAREPFLDAEHVADGAHVNAIGAITPERRELTAALVARCAPVVADSPAAARRLTTELADAGEVWELADVVASQAAAARRATPSLFKAMGIGLADVALGAAVLERAAATGAGRPLPQPRRAAPVLVRRS
jgi:alanine dehydrogenase